MRGPGRDGRAGLEKRFGRDGKDTDGLRELLGERDMGTLIGVRGCSRLGRRRSEGKVARSPHAVGVAGGEGMGLDTEVAKHGVRAPATE